MRMRIAIVGGGISGLASAFELLGHSDVAVDLYEARDRVGGVIRTDRASGLILEGGPDSFLTRKPAAVDLCRELGLEEHLIGTRPDIHGAYIYHAGRLHSIPAGVQSGVPTQWRSLWQSPLLSLRGKLRLLGDWVLPPSRAARTREDVSLGAFLRYRVGNQVVDRIAEPMLSGIYATPADQLSLTGSFPGLLSLEQKYGSLLRGFRARPAPKAPPGPIFMTLDTGLDALPEALVRKMPGLGLHLEQPVHGVEHTESGYRLALGHGDSAPYDGVILATPAPESARMLAKASAEWSRTLDAVPYSDLVVVGLGYEASAVSRPLDRTGYLVPRDPRWLLTAVTWVSAKWAHRHASSLVPLRAFLGRAGGPDLTVLPDEEILDLTRRDLSRSMGLDANPTYSVIFRHRQSMPQYLVGHPSRIGRLTEEMSRSWPGFALAGAAVDGVGLPDCIRVARRAARQVLRDLEPRLA